MIDVFTPDQRSVIMGRIRSRGNKSTELRFIRLLRKYQIKGWRRGSSLPGRPDFVFSKSKVAVFIDGDFWHGNPRKFRIPKSNRHYWSKKIQRNRHRDKEVVRLLKELGWNPVRIWESNLRDSEAIMAKLLLVL